MIQGRMVWGQVRCEPIVSDAVVDPSGETLVADLSVRGVWLPQAEALFDVRIVDTNAQSYLTHTPKSVLFGAEIEKKRNIQLPAVLVKPTLHPYVSQWMD